MRSSHRIACARACACACAALIAAACTPTGAVPVCSPAASYQAPVLQCTSTVEIVPPRAAPPPPSEPPPKRVEVKEERIELGETVQFETDSSKLLPQSQTLLDEVAS